MELDTSVFVIVLFKTIPPPVGTYIWLWYVFNRLEMGI